jgi:hypothetical protein
LRDEAFLNEDLVKKSMQVYGNAFHASTYNDRWNIEVVSDERETRLLSISCMYIEINLTD